MNKNKVLLVAILVLAGFSQSAQARFRFSWSWGANLNFLAPFGRPVAVHMHAPYYPAPIMHPVQPVIVPVAPVMMPAVPHVVYGHPVAPAYVQVEHRGHRRSRPRPSRHVVSHPRSGRRSVGRKVADALGSLHIGLNFFV